MMPPTMPDVDCIDRNVSQQQLDRLLLKTVTANVLTGDDEDMDEKTGLAKMAKPQPRWAKLDMKEIRNVPVGWGARLPAGRLPSGRGPRLPSGRLPSLPAGRGARLPSLPWGRGGRAPALPAGRAPLPAGRLPAGRL